ncbi:MAG: RsiV family protein [Prevotella sp.]
MNIKYLSGKGASKLNQLILSDNIFPPYCNKDSLQNLPLKKRVNSFIQCFFNEFITNVSSINNELHTSKNRYLYHYILKTTINSYKDNIISYLYHHTLAINELSEDDKWIECKNINITTKKVLTLEDVFVRGYEYTLNSLIKRQLLKQFKTKDIKILLEQNVLLTDDINAPKNFIIKENEVIFIYNNGEITNTNIGEIEIKIKNKDLKEILKDRE